MRSRITLCPSQTHLAILEPCLLAALAKSPSASYSSLDTMGPHRPNETRTQSPCCWDLKGQRCHVVGLLQGKAASKAKCVGDLWRMRDFSDNEPAVGRTSDDRETFLRLKKLSSTVLYPRQTVEARLAQTGVLPI